jgi:anti-sigma regulatory factor (Ser/Thr protein kinase)
MATRTKENLIPFLLEQLREFTGPDWEQEDDVTMVLLRQSRQTLSLPVERTILARFDLPSEPGNERRAMEQIGEIVAPLGLPTSKTERLKTAVAEATMNAMEHGNKYSADKPVSIEVVRDERDLIVSITDRGGARLVPEAETPDLMAKLAGEQSPRGWGLFLIRNMVDDLQVVSDDKHHTVNLIIHLSGGER